MRFSESSKSLNRLFPRSDASMSRAVAPFDVYDSRPVSSRMTSASAAATAPYESSASGRVAFHPSPYVSGIESFHASSAPACTTNPQPSA